MTDQQTSQKFFDSTGEVLNGEPNQIRPGVSAIIFDDDGNVLLEQRSDNGHWGLPGGAVDIGESVTNAIVREVMEETSLRVEVKRLVGVYSDPYEHNISSYPDGNIVQWISTCFECERLSGELRMSHESIDLRYFSTDSLPDTLLISHKTRIEDALKNSSLPFVK